MKKIVILVCSLVSFASLAQQPMIVDELVAIVGDNPIMLSEVQRMKQQLIERRKTEGIKLDQPVEDQAVEAMLLNKFLVACARRDSLDKDLTKNMVTEIVESNVNMMVEAAGGVKALEKRYGKAIFQIKRDVEREMLDNELIRMMQAKITGSVKTSYNDVEAFFVKLPLDSLPEMPPQYTFSQIVKMPEATEERKFKIREQLLEFRQRVINGEKLSVLARLYSQDFGSKSRGGEMTSTSRELVPAFAQALELLEPGQISEIVESEYGMHIIELISRRGETFHFRHLLLKPEFTVEEELKVIKELDSLVMLIKTNKTTFEEAAERHSNHPESAQNGGRVMNMLGYQQTGDISLLSPLFAMDELEPNDYRHLSRLEVDSMSIPYEHLDRQGNRVYKIVRLDSKLASHPASMQTDYDILHQIATSDKQNRELDKWIDKNIASMYIYIDPKYRNVQLARKQWVTTSNKFENEGIDMKIPNLEAVKLK